MTERRARAASPPGLRVLEGDWGKGEWRGKTNRTGREGGELRLERCGCAHDSDRVAYTGSAFTRGL